MVINPMVSDGSRTSDIFSENLQHGIIHIVGEVCDEMAASVTAQLLSAKGNSCLEAVDIYINSPGGSVSAGLAIYDAMKYMEKQGMNIRTFCLGRAASMGAVLLSGGTKGQRFLLPHAEVMIHQPSGGMEGQSSDMVIAADHIKEVRDILNGILADNTGKSVEEIRRYTERDYWLRAQDAVAFGIADQVLD